MTDASKYDIWVKANNQVYPGIPFTTVATWIQEGRLLADDQVRAAGATLSQRLAEHPLFAPYLPRPAALAAEDQVEALAPVDLGFGGQKRRVEEDDDPDMIPLIDISLVLLVFFMMTAGALVSGSMVETPPAENARVIQPGETINVSVSSTNGQVSYYFGDDAASLGERELLDMVSTALSQGAKREAVVKANPWISYETVQRLLVSLEKLGVERIEAGVRDSRAGEAAP